MTSRASWDQEVDVLVIGAGGCGLVAAIAAHDAGVPGVAVVEKSPRLRGDTSMSTGSVAAAGTRFQRAAGIEDSAESMLEDFMRLTGPHEMSGLCRVLVRESAGLVEWLVDEVGARLEIITAYRHVGHSVPRLHGPRSRRGQDLVDDLLRAAEKRGIPVALANPVQDLVADEAGAVIGAVVRGDRTRGTRIGARKVIVATNGFGANAEMMRTYCPEMAGAQYFGAEGSTGEAVLWGRQVGAGFANMAAYLGYAAVAYPHGSLLSWTTIEKGGVVVNARGERFGDESVGYSGFAGAVMRQPAPTFAIFDERIREVAAQEEEFGKLLEMGGATRATSIGGLAAATGLDGEALDATLLAYNQAARARTADRFSRSSFGLAPLGPPYFSCRIVPGLFNTQGGLTVDAGGRVLRPDGHAIPNLLAGGGAAAGIAGHTGGAGYASGSGLLAALGVGRLAGRTAAREIQGRA
ncbi:MAG: FAD-dependent oxidoreductase [Candidatus Rokubacteria bacterium]|nr:FAD-dependent oxidoreductase [Candidatus Rokubacteria bacterium]